MLQVEVFKTNMDCSEKARQLLDRIHQHFIYCKANFDLEDCDRILRIVIHNGHVEIPAFINWLQLAGCTAEVLIGD